MTTKQPTPVNLPSRLALLVLSCTFSFASWATVIGIDPTAADGSREQSAAESAAGPETASQSLLRAEGGSELRATGGDLISVGPAQEALLQQASSRGPRQTDAQNDPNAQFSGTRLESGRSGQVEQVFRAYINVRERPGTASARRGGPRGEADEGMIDLEFADAIEAWFAETASEMLAAVLPRRTNERGETSFGVFGIGEFSLSVSDQASITLRESDTTLATQRLDEGSNGGSGGLAYGGVGAGGEGVPPGSQRAASTFQSLLNALLDQLTHPLVLAFGFLAFTGWVGMHIARHVIERRRRRRRPRTRRMKPTHRSDSAQRA